MMSTMRNHRESPIPRVNPSGRKVWVARYTPPDGKRRSAGTYALRRDARDAIDAAYERDYRQRITPDTVGGYFAGRRTPDGRDDGSGWTDRRPRSERTDKTNRGRIRAVLDVPVDGVPLRDWPLCDLRRRHVLTLVDVMLRDQHRAAAGAANVLKAFSVLMEDAITDEIAGSNPFKGVTVRGNDPRVVKPGRKPRVLTWEQMHQLAAAAAAPRSVGDRRDPRTGRWGRAYDVMDPWRAAHAEAMIRMLGDCGLRIGELLGLRRELQDLRSGVFVVAGSAHNGRLVQSSRTKEHDRTGPIPPTTLGLLRSMPARIDSPWLFPAPTGRLWRYDNWMRDVWNPARETSKVDATPHDFRHSWVSNLAAAGVDAADLADIAGHGIEVLQGRYRHALHRSFDRVREVIG